MERGRGAGGRVGGGGPRGDLPLVPTARGPDHHPRVRPRRVPVHAVCRRHLPSVAVLIRVPVIHTVECSERFAAAPTATPIPRHATLPLVHHVLVASLPLPSLPRRRRPTTRSSSGSLYFTLLIPVTTTTTITITRGRFDEVFDNDDDDHHPPRASDVPRVAPFYYSYSYSYSYSYLYLHSSGGRGGRR